MDDEYRDCLALGVMPGAPASEVKRAYRILVRRWHPDRVHSDERKRREAEERLRSINRAYRSLVAAARRAESLKTGARPAQPGYDPFSWRQGLAESGREAASLEDDRSFYRRALDLHFRGMDHFAATRYREAVSSLTQSVCLVQNNPEAYRTLARAHRRLGQPAKSASAYQKALQIEPDSSESRYELGETLLVLGDAAGASRQAELLEHSDSELAHFLRESIAGHSGKRLRSREDLG